MTSLRISAALLLLPLFSALFSCHREASPAEADHQVLVSVGDSSLTVTDVVSRIPHGISSEDSALMFRRIVDSWVSGLVMAEVAEKNIPDIDRIERMVENYRNALIVRQYLANMSEQADPHIPESRVREYYNAHRDEFILTQPLVKGAFIKVDENASQLPDIRRWMAQFTEESFDKIERSGLRHATAYEYFRDTWHEWNDVAERIPYRFFDADAFVRSTKDFETSAEGSAYLLHISEYLASGQEMPYEFAKSRIREMLRATEISAVRDKLKEDIYRKKIQEGLLKPGLYDPVRQEMKSVSNQDSQSSI